MKTIDIKGKEYITVNERLIYFNENYKNGSITTDIVSHDGNEVIIKATIIPDIATPERKFTGYARELADSSFINKTSHIENCETSAVGRALGMLGVGIDTSIASADEVINAIHNQNPIVTKQKELITLIGDDIEKAQAIKQELGITKTVSEMTEQELDKMIKKAKE